MSVAIDPRLCQGCGGCVEVCPGGILGLSPDGKSAVALYPNDCWGCAACLKECSRGAASLSLSPAMGGRGAKMTAFWEGGELFFKVEFLGGDSVSVKVDSGDPEDY